MGQLVMILQRGDVRVDNYTLEKDLDGTLRLSKRFIKYIMLNLSK